MITVRQATHADAELITQHNCMMAMETEHKTLNHDLVLTAVKAAFEDPAKGFYLMAEVDGQNAGNLMVTFEWSDWRNCNMWWIQSVYVAKEYRRRGVYRALYDKVKEMAVQEGVKIIRLYVEKENTIAQKTYESLGMKESNYYLYEIEILPLG